MTTTAYKGFTIESKNVYTGPALGNQDGYVVPKLGETFYLKLNNAKGAITKHLNAASAEVVDVVEATPESGVVRFSLPEAPYTPPNGPTGDYLPREVAQVQPDPNDPQWTFERNLKGEPLAANPKWAKIYAEIDYYGMDKVRDSRSRNKREGKYAGRPYGRHTRSQRAAQPGRDIFGRTA